MAYDRFHINSNGSFNTGQKQSLLKTFDEVAAGTVSPQTAPTALTDNSTGTGSNTIAAITSTAPADFAAVGVQLGIIKNAIASLAAKENAVLTALHAAGVTV